MNLITRISILVFCAIIATLLLLPFSFNNASLKFRIEQKISQKLDSNFEIKGKVDIAFLPKPKITIHGAEFHNVKYDENVVDLHVKNLIMKLDLFSLISRKVKINKLIFDSPKMELDITHPLISARTTDQKSSEELKKTEMPIKGMTVEKIFNFKDVDMETFSFKNISAIEVINGTFVKRDNNDKIALEFSNIEFKVNNKKNIFVVDGNFISDEIPTEFKMVINTSKNKNSTLIVHSPILKIELNGKFNDSKISDLVRSNFSGKLDAEIINLKAVLNKYFSKNSLLYGKINSSKPIKISSDIEGIAGEISAKNIVINSQLISGNGQIDANFSIERPVIDIDVTLKNVDVDSIWISDNKAASNNSNTSESESNIIGNFINGEHQDSQNLDFDKTKIILTKEPEETPPDGIAPRNIDLTAEIKIETAKYLDAELKDISLYFIVAGQNQILLQPLLLKSPGGGMLRVIGAFANENNIPKFIGKIDASGKNLQQFLSWMKIEPHSFKQGSLADYNMVTDILLLPNFIILNNFYAGLNNNKNLIFGNIKINNSNSTSNISSDFNIDDLDVEDYFSITNQSQYLSSGSLLKDLLWLNSTTSNNNISLFFSKLTYKENTFYNQPLKMEFGQGYFKLNNLQLQSDNINVKGFLNINLTNNNPIIDISLDAENFNYVTKKSEENSPAPTDASGTNSNFKSGFVEQFFNFPSLGGLNGTIAVNVANLKIDGVAMDNIKIAGTMKDGELKISDAELNLYKGNLKYSGSVILKNTKAFNGSFELTNIDNQSFLGDLLSLDNISGISNISGVASVAGKTRDEFFKNLDMQLKFVSGNIVVDGFGINDLAKKMSAPAQNKEELSRPINILFNKNYSSYFKNASGNLDIRRGGRNNQLRIETSTVGMNSITTGSLDLGNNIFSGTSNFIFITGSMQRQIPISIAINYNGKFENILKNANVDQVSQYLSR